MKIYAFFFSPRDLLRRKGLRAMHERRRRTIAGLVGETSGAHTLATRLILNIRMTPIGPKSLEIEAKESGMTKSKTSELPVHCLWDV